MKATKETRINLDLSEKELSMIVKIIGHSSFNDRTEAGLDTEEENLFRVVYKQLSNLLKNK